MYSRWNEKFWSALDAWNEKMVDTFISGIDTHFNLRTDQVEQRIGPEPFALVDLSTNFFPSHAAQHAHFLPGQGCRRGQLDRLRHIR